MFHRRQKRVFCEAALLGRHSRESGHVPKKSNHQPPAEKRKKTKQRTIHDIRQFDNLVAADADEEEACESPSHVQV